MSASSRTVGAVRLSCRSRRRFTTGFLPLWRWERATRCLSRASAKEQRG
jgi:hypothetical protein